MPYKYCPNTQQWSDVYWRIRYQTISIKFYVELKHWGRDRMAAIFQTIFSNAFAWMKMYGFRLQFYWTLFVRVKLKYLSIGSDYGLAPTRRIQIRDTQAIYLRQFSIYLFIINIFRVSFIFWKATTIYDKNWQWNMTFSSVKLEYATCPFCKYLFSSYQSLRT